MVNIKILANFITVAVHVYRTGWTVEVGVGGNCAGQGGLPSGS